MAKPMYVTVPAFMKMPMFMLLLGVLQKFMARSMEMLTWGGYTEIYGSVYGNAKVTGHHTIRGLVHGNARLKRDGYSYTEQNPYYVYGIPKDCEIYENDTVVKISKNNARAVFIAKKKAVLL
ncbi:hypothetical protein GGR08_000414 [Bartonella fuyuanensis]|uniref:Phage related protein n=1 Tax=Bartonella fuyuanensis TaxID=1460968 RepID=A0A840E4N7_9HYPH|nr:hypothetical protein [Bartonella fuyuanensis]MBB4076126.1 hypothetical protein [Bartonella fuyuanensis]